MKLVRLIVLASVVFSSAASAQQPGGGPMMGNMPDDIKEMMQEPNKALAQASIQYMIVFTRSLNTQASERRDKINSAYIRSAFGEMKRAYNMIERFQKAHVQTMDAAMQERVGTMMMRMNNNLAGIKTHLDVLEKEVNGRQSLDTIAERTRAILTHLDDMPRPRQGGMGMSGGQQGMMR